MQRDNVRWSGPQGTLLATCRRLEAWIRWSWAWWKQEGRIAGGWKLLELYKKQWMPFEKFRMKLHVFLQPIWGYRSSSLDWERAVQNETPWVSKQHIHKVSYPAPRPIVVYLGGFGPGKRKMGVFWGLGPDAILSFTPRSPAVYTWLERSKDRLCNFGQSRNTTLLCYCRFFLISLLPEKLSCHYELLFS